LQKEVLKYVRERQEEDKFLLELGNDTSLENIRRVVRKNIFGDKDIEISNQKTFLE
jgi:hypothetical protein